MKLPGFTAERSLHHPLIQVYQGHSFVGVIDNLIIPQT
jgi:hypothetical protein